MHARQNISTKAAYPLSYYQQILIALIAGIAANATHASIAANLHESGSQTPAGRVWSGAAVKQLCKILRDPKQYPSRINDALLQLIAAKEIPLEEAATLRQLRTYEKETT